MYTTKWIECSINWGCPSETTLARIREYIGSANYDYTTGDFDISETHLQMLLNEGWDFRGIWSYDPRFDEIMSHRREMESAIFRISQHLADETDYEEVWQPLLEGLAILENRNDTVFRISQMMADETDYEEVWQPLLERLVTAKTK